MSKKDMLREQLEKEGNLHLFEETEDGFEGDVSLHSLDEQFRVFLDVEEDSPYNTITIRLGCMSREKFFDALQLLNQFNSYNPNGQYFLLDPENPENPEDPYLVFFRCTYTALADVFDADVYTSILAAVLDDIATGDEYKQLMQLRWK